VYGCTSFQFVFVFVTFRYSLTLYFVSTIKEMTFSSSALFEKFFYPLPLHRECNHSISMLAAQIDPRLTYLQLRSLSFQTNYQDTMYLLLSSGPGPGRRHSSLVKKKERNLAEIIIKVI
jgi:hypothetical protein